MSRFDIRVDRNIWRDSVDIVLFEQRGEKTYIGKPVVMEQFDGVMETDPTIRIPLENAQLLIDELWRVGLRPTEGTGSAGALRAVEKHLHDMRCIVFKNNPMNKK